MNTIVEKEVQNESKNFFRRRFCRTLNCDNYASLFHMFFKVFFIGGFTRKAVSLIAQCKMAVTFVECQLSAFIYVSFYFL